MCHISRFTLGQFKHSLFSYQNVKPSKFTICNSSQTETVRQVYEWTAAEFTSTRGLLGTATVAPWNSSRDWCGLHSYIVTVDRISEQALIAFHSKGGWCNSWDLPHCDDHRSPWWTRRHGPQHDRSRSDTVMICMNLNISVGLVRFFIIPVLFCFVLWTRNYIYYTGVSCVWLLVLFVF